MLVTGLSILFAWQQSVSLVCSASHCACFLQQKLTAFVRFDPPSAVVLHNKHAAQRAGQGPAAGSSASGAGARSPQGPKKRSKAAGTVGGGASHPQGWLCKIDGNVIELSGDYRCDWEAGSSENRINCSLQLVIAAGDFAVPCVLVCS